MFSMGLLSRCFQRIVVTLERKISIYNFTRNPQELHQIETAYNPRGMYGTLCI